MGMFSKSKDDVSDEICVACGSVLDISRVTEFHRELKAALGKGGVIMLDGAEVEKVDAAALQLCAAFFHAADARKVKAKWLTPSEPLVRAASLLGLEKQLGLPAAN